MCILELEKTIKLKIDKRVVSNILMLDRPQDENRFNSLNYLKDKEFLKLKHNRNTNSVTIKEIEHLNDKDINHIFGFKYNIHFYTINKLEEFLNRKDTLNLIGKTYIILNNTIYFNNTEFVTEDDIYKKHLITGVDVNILFTQYKDVLIKTKKLTEEYNIKTYNLSICNGIKPLRDLLNQKCKEIIMDMDNLSNIKESSYLERPF